LIISHDVIYFHHPYASIAGQVPVIIGHEQYCAAIHEGQATNLSL